MLQVASSIIILRESTTAKTTVSRGSSSKPPKVKPRQAPDAAGTAKTPRVTTMRDMIESVLRDSGRDMNAKEIHEAIAQRYGKDLNLASVNSALARFASLYKTVERVATGRYAFNEPAPPEQPPGEITAG